MSRIAVQHSLVRTSPKGGPFVGKCVLCGEEGLSLSATRWCPNPQSITEEQAVLTAIKHDLEQA